jgi:glycosyltransferase involved in cell wall biosynthesis
MATHNRATVLPRAIDSVLPQLLPQDELIVIDDGSRDATVSVMDGYVDRVRFESQDNQGPSVARNHGIRLATGDYIAFLDDDDEYLPHHVHAMRTVLDHCPDVVYAFTNFDHEVTRGVFQPSFIQESGPQFDQWVARQTRIHRFAEFGPGPDGCPDFRVVVGNDYATQLEIEYAVTGVLMVRRSLAGDELHFSEDISSYLDWDLTSRLGAGSRVLSPTRCDLPCALRSGAPLACAPIDR